MMRRILDTRLRGASYDQAMVIGMDHLREQARKANAFPCGCALVECSGGWEINLSWQTRINRGGRSGRHKFQNHSAKVISHADKR